MRPKKISDLEILQVVRQCLVEQGGTVSTQYIADQVGVSQATLFKRFGSKSNLLQMATIIGPQAEKAILFKKKLDLGPTTAPVKEQLRDLCLEMLRLFDEILPCFASLHASGMAFDGPVPESAPPVQIRKSLTRWVETLQGNGRLRAEIHPESVALTIMGAVQHRPLRIHLIRDTNLTQTDEEYIHSIVDVLWMGLTVHEDRGDIG